MKPNFVVISIKKYTKHTSENSLYTIHTFAECERIENLLSDLYAMIDNGLVIVEKVRVLEHNNNGWRNYVNVYTKSQAES